MTKKKKKRAPRPPAKNPDAVALGSIRSRKKARSSRENGKRGGRPPNSEPKAPEPKVGKKAA